MSSSTFLPEEYYRYMLEHSAQETPLLRRLREETLATGVPQMQISPDQGMFLHLLLRAMNAANAIEIGTFTGYSSLCIASALPANGRLIACDISDEWTSVARRYWKEAGLESRIDLRLAPAIDTLTALRTEGMGERFDFAFIDADKPMLSAYVDAVLPLLRTNGLIAIDNTLRNGAVVNDPHKDKETVATAALNDRLRNDPRLLVLMTGMADGVTLALKQGNSAATLP